MAAGASVVVVGGGVMGCSIAFHLAERGADVLVLERGTVCSGMSARSGALVRMHYTNEPEARMALAGLGYFQSWQERVGGWCGFTVTGAAILVGPGEGERLRRNVAMLRRVGVDTEAVAPAELAAEHPELDLAGVELAAVEPGSGYADPVATTFAFASRAVDLGGADPPGRGRARPGRGRRPGGRGRHRRRPGRGRRGGAGLRALGRPAGPHGRVRAGHHPRAVPDRLLPAARGGPPPPGGDRRGPRHLLPPPCGGLSLLGVEAGHHIAVDAIDREVEGYDHDVVAPALGRLAGRVPAFAGAPFARGHRGVYDTSADSRAVLDAAPGVPGCSWPAASPAPASRIPAVGACMAELVTRGPGHTVDIHPFRLGRFAEGDPIVGDEYALPPDSGTACSGGSFGRDDR
jgi:sarcosine oxidase subunit beta